MLSALDTNIKMLINLLQKNTQLIYYTVGHLAKYHSKIANNVKGKIHIHKSNWSRKKPAAAKNFLLKVI